MTTSSKEKTPEDYHAEWLKSLKGTQPKPKVHPLRRAVRETLCRVLNCEVQSGDSVGETRNLLFSCRDEAHFERLKLVLHQFYTSQNFLHADEFEIVIRGYSKDIPAEKARAAIENNSLIPDKEKQARLKEKQARLSEIFDENGDYKKEPVGLQGEIILKYTAQTQANKTSGELEKRSKALYDYAGQGYKKPKNLPEQKVA